MDKKRRKFKQPRLLKYLPTILICTLIFPANYSGKPLRLNFTLCDPESPNTKCPISTFTYHTKLNDDATNYPAVDKILDQPTVTKTFLTSSILILILATLLLSLILGYFYSVPIVKQSLVLYLHRDISKLTLLLNGSASMSIVTCYAYGNGVTITPTTAKVVAYFLSNLVLYLLLAFNAQGFLHLYSMKEMVLDPTLPGMDDDRVAIKMMRFISIVFVTFLTSLLFAYEGYPKPYYSMTGDTKLISELPIGTVAFTMLLFVLIVTYIITSLAAVFYTQRSIYFGDSTTIPRGLRHLSLLFIFFLGLGVSAIMFNSISDGDIWIVLLIYQILFGVLSPITLILTSSQLKDYVKGIFQAFTLFVRDFYEQYCSCRSPQVHPMEE